MVRTFQKFCPTQSVNNLGTGPTGRCLRWFKLRSPGGGSRGDRLCLRETDIVKTVPLNRFVPPAEVALRRVQLQSLVGVAKLALTRKIGIIVLFYNTADGPKFTLTLTSPSYSLAGRGLSFQITVLKVLAGHPEGRASLADLKHYVAVLTCSGADWSKRMKRLAARAPELDMFSSGYVLREASGWQITEKGREFLMLIEAPLAEPALTQVAFPPPVISDPTDLPPNVIQLASHKVQRRRAAA